jgi:ribosome modulation factor
MSVGAEKRQEGYEACFDGSGDDENPYVPGTDEHASWNDGWYECQEEMGIDD